MRLVRIIPATVLPAIVAGFLSSTAFAQVWDEYVNRENFFQVNMPGEPTETQVPYRTVKGTDLTANVFTASAPKGSVTEGTYKVTVVDYTKNQNELSDAIEQARAAIKAKGTVKYDGVNNLDGHRSWRITVETPTSRILGEILIAANNHVYIVEGETPLAVPPSAQFQASIQILNNEGVRIRTPTRIAAPEYDAGAEVGKEAQAAEISRVVAAISGSWRNPTGGSCDAAYFKSGARGKSPRNEESIAGTVTNSGTTITGQLIVVGAREGQFVDGNDRPIFLFENKPGDKLTFTPIGGPAASWPEVTLELCPGSRG
jgi:hypothetical protein